MNNETLRKRIKKLFALSRSPNEHEAMAALKKAEMLLKEYSLSKEDVFITHQAVKGTVRHCSWRMILRSAIEWLNGTVSIREVNAGEYIFYGDDMAVTVSCEMYRYLERAIERIAKQSIRKNAKSAFRNAFKLGVARNIHARIMEMGENASWFDRTERRKEIRTFIDKDMEVVNQNVTLLPLSSVGFSKGFNAGNAISLHRQAGGRQVAQINEKN